METFISQLTLANVGIHLVDLDNPKHLVSFIAVAFEDWIRKKLDETTNAWFRFILNCFVHCRDYRTVRESIKNGDSIMLELLQQRFIYVWAAIGKPKCFENALCAVPFYALQLIRENRTGKLYDGVD